MDGYTFEVKRLLEKKMNREEFLKNLAELMRLRGWDQRDAAASLGMSEQSVGKYINGTREPIGATKILVSKLLDDARREVLADLQKKLGQQMMDPADLAPAMSNPGEPAAYLGGKSKKTAAKVG